MLKIVMFLRNHWFSVWLSIVFFFLCLLNISEFPIFQDEAEFLYLAENIIQSNYKNIFISLNQGIVPVFIWTITLFAEIIGDTLVAGRIVNVLYAASIFYIFIIIRKIFNLSKNFENYASFILFCSPLILLQTRTSLLDMSVMVLTAWYIVFALWYLQEKMNTYFIFHIIFLTLAFFTKATAIFGIVPIFIAQIIFIKNKSISFKDVRRFLVLYAVFGLFYLIFILVAGKYFIYDSGLSLITNLDFSQVVNKIKTNIWLLFHWVKAYYLPFFVYILLFVFSRKKQINNISIVMFSWAFFALLVMILLNRYFYPRHILIISIPLIVITSTLLEKQKTLNSLVLILLMVILNFGLYRDILISPERALLAKEDTSQYFQDFTSGKNIKDIGKYLFELSNNEKILVWLDGTWVMEYGLRRELKGNSNVVFNSYGLDENMFTKVDKVIEINGIKNYVMVNRSIPETNKRLSKIKEFQVSFRHSQILYLLE